MASGCCPSAPPACGCGESKSTGLTASSPGQTGSKLSFADRLGAWRMRWGMGRGNYRVEPGLYGLPGSNADSPVLVTANYKMTFDRLRSELAGIAAWILVLDTKAINVWCAAGKGTFGTDELVRRIETSDLKAAVRHRRLILPQLGAPGVAAHEVKRRTGFDVKYGPVLARDLPRYLDDGMKATASMRRVRFGWWDRVALVPMEVIPALKITVGLAVLALGLRLLADHTVSAHFWADAFTLAGAIVSGSILVQLFLPLIPGRSFAFKGGLMGLAWAAAFAACLGLDVWSAASNLLLVPAVASFFALNFTGATTFTSLSGVEKEIKTAVPVIITAVGAGLLLRIMPLIFS
jgi:hypothetical protein